MLWAFGTCLTEGEPRGFLRESREGTEPLIRCEEALAASPSGLPTLGEICRSIGTTERKLRTYSQEILGMSPGRYLRLRRFKSAPDPAAIPPKRTVEGMGTP